MTTALPYLALSMGLISSIHCIGMCGPIALALPVRTESKWRRLAGSLTYNSGRTFTYGCLGMIVGTIGTSLSWLGFLRYGSILIGGLMLASVLWPAAVTRHMHFPALWTQMVSGIKQRMGKALKRGNVSGTLVLGMLNGLIPCGLVYMALVSSVATGSVVGGGIFMLLFGLGTIPAMAGIGLAGQLLTPALRTRFRKLTPVLIAVAGIWLIARGIVAPHHDKAEMQTTITMCR
ncbi:sulfite exporter TauE/SafE family protein [Dyadobacter sp. MSC1_007]|jgi:sulfite exporter TauE/SafE|uniref:sulfite exporter TauE/SafE family protein n=1 Tax=Dyadobacter sp. MSC1_007 TaxID=2909264 RepID=UPI00202E89B9|nr:sulfite exporter TauE/SafE family protein [Dyadobacter sp. MSC1_007]